MSDEDLQIAEKRREVKGKGEKERYTHLNVEVQRLDRIDMKAFFSDQQRKIEENHRMRTIRDLFKKIQTASKTVGVPRRHQRADTRKP